jgi:hypothetical protein
MKRATGSGPHRGGFLCAATVALACLHMSGAAAQEARDVRAPDHGLEFYVSEDALQALYQRPMDLGDLGETQVNLGFFLNEERDLIGMVDLLATIQVPPQSRWAVNLGPRMYGALMNVEDTDVFAVGLGGQVRYALTPDHSTNVTLGGFYSPSILTFGEADNTRDVHLRLETRLADGMQIFVGYRLFEWDMSIGPTDDPLNAQTRKVDDGVQLGFRATF